MALEPITRQEKIIAGENLTPITRMEMFLKNFGGGGGGSVPKPLTYDYMPEGYPKKSVLFDIEWDGNTDGLTSVVASGLTYYRVSDMVPTNDELLGGIVGRSDGGDELTVTSDVIRYKDEYVIMVAEVVIIIQEDNATWDEVLFPQKGIYFPKIDDSLYVSRLTKYNYTTVDSAYIHPFNPNNVYVSGLPTPNQIYDFDEALSAIIGQTTISQLKNKKAVFDYVFYDGTALLRLMPFSVTEQDGTKTIEYTGVDTQQMRVCAIEFCFNGSTDDSVLTSVNIKYPSAMYINSSTTGSAKQFKITVDDSGTISATEVT